MAELLAEEDPRLQLGYRFLAERMNALVTGRPMDQFTVDRVIEAVDDFRANFRQRYGAEFPPMGLFYLPSVPYLVLVRTDLTEEESRVKLHDIIRSLDRLSKMPAAIEIAAAVQRVWPRYRAQIESLRRDPKIKQAVN